ncbi:MAG: DUF3631 domain-containing protein [Alphaproteobacteria bacterium]|nr:DUF3631 domain-containing protein [Alphaproteobacteria bacterium]
MLENSFLKALSETGISTKDKIIPDGKLHRFQVEGDKAGSKNGWYILFSGEISAGAFGCWKRDIKQNWCEKSNRSLTKAEKIKLSQKIEEAKKLDEIERANINKQAKSKAQSIWSNSSSYADNHPYLIKKRVKNYGLKVSNNRLVIPLLDAQGEIHSLQFIDVSGNKRFLSGGKKKGAYFAIGSHTDIICIAEGYATAASIHESTGAYTAISFDSGNMKSVAKTLREKFPNSKIILCADNDSHGVGEDKAKKAAKAVNGYLATINKSAEITDFNDLYNSEGPESVKTIINKAHKPMVHKKETKEKNSLNFEVAEPWEEPVNGVELFDELVTIFKTYLILSDYQAEVLALWALFSYCINANNIAPKLLIYSPEKRCGKTTLIDVLIGLVCKPLPASNISPAAVYRTIEAVNPTLIIDEADTFLKADSEMTGIINSGHRKSAAYVIRLMGDNHEPKQFSTWAATIIGMIGKPADTIVDRSILIQMRRKKPDEMVERFVIHKTEKYFEILRRKIVRWIYDHFDAFSEAEPKTPKELNDRATDNWRPLFAIADCIGSECSDLARKASLALAYKDDEDEGSAGEMLLTDIRLILEERNQSQISTSDLLYYLVEIEERPWMEWNRGKPLSARQLSNKLKPFGISPTNITDSFGKRRKGYNQLDFAEAFERYIPDSPSSNLSVQPYRNNDKPYPAINTACTDNVRQEILSVQPYTSSDKKEIEDWAEQTLKSFGE